ncbi:hypothetical protein INR49_005633 [Caranx melampygus]|nr:hypothetical protein INR49_005633 [Caranx melampygus]
MEVNRDEAERCIDIATAALTNDQPEKAQSAAGPNSKEWIYTQTRQPVRVQWDFGASTATDPSEDTRPEEKPSETSKSYTADQLDAVKRIKQSIGNAYAVLSNANKRRQYDQCEEERKHPSRHGPDNGNFEPDISPEDLFNMFFGGGYPSSNANVYANGRMRHQRRERRERQRDGGLALFVQVMPILILVIVSALSQIMVNSPPTASASGRDSAGYTQKRLTENLKVPYYVGEQFSKEFVGMNLKNLERTVEDDYISNLRNNCWKEKQQKEGMLYRARYFGDTDLYQRAQRARTPSCAKLSEITASLHG